MTGAFRLPVLWLKTAGDPLTARLRVDVLLAGGAGSAPDYGRSGDWTLKRASPLVLRAALLVPLKTARAR
jgi:hypothetical protein